MLKTVASLAFASALVLPCAAQTCEVRVMSSGATASAYLQLIPQLEAKQLKAVTLATATGVGKANIVTRIRGGEPFDVVLISAATMDDLIKTGHVDASSRVDIARSAIGVGVRAGRPRPDISSVDALKRAFLDASSIAISAQISGVYLTSELLPKLGIAEPVMPKIKRIESVPVGEVVAVMKQAGLDPIAR